MSGERLVRHFEHPPDECCSQCGKPLRLSVACTVVGVAGQLCKGCFDKRTAAPGEREQANREEFAALPWTSCALPPPGWCCTRRSGHEGPCAALPSSDDVDPVVARHLGARAVERARTEDIARDARLAVMASNIASGIVQTYPHEDVLSTRQMLEVAEQSIDIADAIVHLIDARRGRVR